MVPLQAQADGGGGVVLSLAEGAVALVKSAKLRVKSYDHIYC
jgi:hypothetical protein